MKTFIKPGMSTNTIMAILKTKTISTPELESFLFDGDSGQFEHFLVYPDSVDDKVIGQLKGLYQAVIKQTTCTPRNETTNEKSISSNRN